jgi:S-(hydroxymethyl)glutathione dehydrogenase/alcohol dehydrogenase
MRAAILTGYNEPMVVEEVAAAAMGPRDVLVHIDASGVCHSDLSMANGNVPLPPPAILGHEGAGTVLAVGSEVSRVGKGDRVIASFVPACGNCFFCLRDQSQLCEQMGAHSMVSKGTRADGSSVIGMSGLGTFADEMTVDESMLVKVESDLPAEQLALIGCGVTTGVGAALNTARVEPGSIVAVIGCGGVGQAVIQGASIAGAARIIAIDPVAMKRDAALTLGATDVVDPSAVDPIEAVKMLSGGRGADYAFEVIGTAATIRQAVATARPGGTAVMVGVPRLDSDVAIPAMSVLEEKTILGCVYGSAQVRRDFPKLISLVEQGKLDLGSMVSRTMHLDDINDAFKAMQAGEVIRSVLV